MNLFQNLPRFGFYLFLFALGLAPLLGGTPIGNEYAMAAWGGDGMLGILRALIILAALLTAMGAGTPTNPTGLGFLSRYSLYAAAAWVALSLMVHSQGLTSQIYLFAMLPDLLNWLTFILAFDLATRFATEEKRNISWMAIALLVGGAICAIVGIMSFGAVPLAERAMHRESATFFSPNFAAGFAALTIPLAAALFLSAETLLPIAASGAAAGLLFGLLMITGSRAGLGLTLGGLVVALVLTLVRRVSLNWGRVGALVGIIALFGFAFRDPMLGRVNTPTAATGTTAAASASSGDHSGEFRKETWKGSLAMAKANPVFGGGPGTFPYVYTRYATVGWTGHAHSSYLQIASEDGFLALGLLLLGIATALIAGLGAAVKSATSSDKATVILLPALVGGTLAALGRSVFDSEWMLLGCGIPFFTAIGILAANYSTEAKSAEKSKVVIPRLVPIVFLAVILFLTLWIRANQANRDSLTVMSRSNSDAAATAHEAANRVRPSDPQLFALGGDYKMAAYLSPSGKRLFQLARFYEKQSDDPKAVEIFKESVTADPNNLQTRKALAEAQLRTDDKAGALATYADMVRIAEGPAGQIRAIPELTDTLPAFAYTALAEDALAKGNTEGGEKNFAAAEKIIEEYSQTAKIYQISEALTLGGNTASRRAEVRSLYTDRILPGRRTVLKKLGRTVEAEALTQIESETTTRLDAFVDPMAGGSGS